MSDKEPTYERHKGRMVSSITKWWWDSGRVKLTRLYCQHGKLPVEPNPDLRNG